MNDMDMNIVVLMGGFSKEREVSLNSGLAVGRGLEQAGYQVTLLDVTKSNFDLPPDTSAVFIALHGEFGEDGTVQERLENLGIPYTGSGSVASRLSFDKVLSKQALQNAGIKTPAFEVLRPGERRTMPLPAVVKPPRQGSSFGVHIVLTESDWESALAESMAYNGEVMVEKFIPGKELTVGIVGEEILPVIEIRAPDNNYDYRAKYTQGLTSYLVPAPLPAEIALACQSAARQTFNVLGGSGFGRVDFRLDFDGDCYVLELNTIPGFTETSLLPKAAASADITFTALCDRILKLALKNK